MTSLKYIIASLITFLVLSLIPLHTSYASEPKPDWINSNWSEIQDTVDPYQSARHLDDNWFTYSIATSISEDPILRINHLNQLFNTLYGRSNLAIYIFRETANGSFRVFAVNAGDTMILTPHKRSYGYFMELTSSGKLYTLDRVELLKENGGIELSADNSKEIDRLEYELIPLLHPLHVKPSISQFFPSFPNQNPIVLNQNIYGSEQILVFETSDAVELELLYDNKVVFSKSISAPPKTSAYVNVSKALTDLKLPVGTYTFTTKLYRQLNLDPVINDWTIKIVKDGGQGGEQGTDGGDTDTGEGGLSGLPEAPSPPESSWDVVGWLKYLIDWLLYIFKVIGWSFDQIGSMAKNLFSSANGLTAVLTGVFGFLPKQVVQVMVLGIICALIVSIIKR